ncbi:MAG: hypothetical protein U0996_19725 [Planctomycetaceae bacterium]
MNLDHELLTSLSEEELEALAASALAPSSQNRLNELLEMNSTGQLSESTRSELDELLAQIDHLNIIKARARYTLEQHSGTTKT